jgi:hypothetical protein
LANPRGFALDPTGTNLYVADGGAARVNWYNAYTGQFQGWLGKINGAGGTCTVNGAASNGFCNGSMGEPSTAIANGTFSIASDVAVDPTGHYLYVSDLQNATVQRFDLTSNGAFAGWIGYEGAAATSCASDSPGCSLSAGTFTNGWAIGGNGPTAVAGPTGDGELGWELSPPGSNVGEAIALNASYIYVTDYCNKRVVRYNYNGTSAGWLGLQNTTATACLSGSCTLGAGLATNGWVSGGTGMAGPDDGQFNGPGGLALDATHIYVADAANSRVVRLNLDGTSPQWFGAVSSSSTSASCPTGNVFSGTWCTGAEGEPTTTAYPATFNGGTSNPVGLGIDTTDGWLFVSDPNNNRILKYNSATAAYLGSFLDAPTESTSWTTFGSGVSTPGTSDGMFGSATSASTTGFDYSGEIAADFTNGYLYVVDGQLARVDKFNLSSGAFIGWIGMQNTAVNTGGGCTSGVGLSTGAWCTGGSSQAATTATEADGNFQIPFGLAVAPSGGSIFVSDYKQMRVEQFNASTGAFMGWIGYQSTTAATACESGSTCNLGTSRFTGGWASGGKSTSNATALGGGLKTPMGIAADSTYIYVADEGDSRLVRYKQADGSFQGWIGEIAATGTCGNANTVTTGWCTDATVTSKAGTGTNAFTGILYVKLDGLGNLWTYDAPGGSGRIQRFTASSGAFIVGSNFTDTTTNSLVSLSVDSSGNFAIGYESQTGGFNLYNVAGGYMASLGSGWTQPTGGQSGCTTFQMGLFPTLWCTGGLYNRDSSFLASGQNLNLGGTMMDPNGQYFYYFDPINGQLVKVPMNQ